MLIIQDIELISMVVVNESIAACKDKKDDNKQNKVDKY